MAYFNEFPHTRMYDGDLGWLIKMYKELLAQYKSNNEYLDEINQKIEDMTEEQLKEWLDDGTFQNIISSLVFNYKINVVDRGIKNDGVTDVTEALNTLFAENPNSSFYFPKGKYLISSPLYLQSNMEICGDFSNTIIFTKTGVINNGIELLSGADIQNVYIHDITLINTGYGNGENQSEGSLIGTGAGIFLKRSSNILILNNIIKKCGGVFNDVNQGIGNIYLSRCRNSIISNNFISECQNGICLDDWIVSEDNFFTRSIIISNNQIDNGNGRAITVDLNSGNPFNGVIISNNKISNFGYSGIDIKGVLGCLTIGNLIDGKATEKYYPTTSLSDTIYGMQIDYNAQYILIVGNFIQWVKNGLAIFRCNNIKLTNNYIECSNNANNSVLFIKNTQETKIDSCSNTYITNTANADCFLIDNTNSFPVILNSISDIFDITSIAFNINASSKISKFKILNAIFKNGVLFFSANNADEIIIKNSLFQNAQIINIGEINNLLMDGNLLDDCDTGYRFYGTCGNAIIGDTFNGVINTVLFDTTSATIQNGNISKCNINTQNTDKLKNGGGLKFMRIITDNTNALYNDGDMIILPNNYNTYAIVKTSAGNKNINFS